MIQSFICNRGHKPFDNSSFFRVLCSNHRVNQLLGDFDGIENWNGADHGNPRDCGALKSGPTCPVVLYKRGDSISYKLRDRLEGHRITLQADLANDHNVANSQQNVPCLPGLEATSRLYP